MLAVGRQFTVQNRDQLYVMVSPVFQTICHNTSDKVVDETLSPPKNTPVDFYLFIWVLTSLSTLYRSYHDGQFYGQRKPVHTVGQGSVL